MRFYVELSPAGGYNVKLEGADAPVSHHDTAEEAEAKLLAYARGVERRAPPPDPSGELVTLRDGTTVLIRPVLSEDKPLFTAGFERLGELVIERAEAGAYVIQVSLPLGAELQEALRAAAAREVGP